ncbi:SLOG family protein [Deinococcus arboris]|uniref:SLOG family protein n=1 Tax=Deinococcus arboris TaxID=2682977 RepID=UPI0012FBD62F
MRGRHFADHEQLHLALAHWIAQHGWPTEIVSGAVPGADRLGEEWAAENGVQIKRFPAAWREHGRRAGPIRNGQMAAYADGCLALPGGTGTADMLRRGWWWWSGRGEEADPQKMLTKS